MTKLIQKLLFTIGEPTSEGCQLALVGQKAEKRGGNEGGGGLSSEFDKEKDKARVDQPERVKVSKWSAAQQQCSECH